MKYCLECGAKIEYTNKIPKFCGECGASLNGSSAASNTNVREPESQQRRQSSRLSSSENPERGWDKDGLDVDMPDLSNFRLELTEKVSSSISCRPTTMAEISKETPGIYDSSGIRMGIKRMDKEMNKRQTK
jgi:hypothetical protein